MKDEKARLIIFPLQEDETLFALQSRADILVCGLFSKAAKMAALLSPFIQGAQARCLRYSGNPSFAIAPDI